MIGNGNLLEARTVLVAGGTGNVGRHLVSELLSAGATVVVPSRSKSKLDRLAARMDAERRGRFVPLLGNITDEDDSARLQDEAVGRTGRIDGVAASLGTFVSAPSLLSAPRRDLEKAIDGYLLSHFAVARRLIPPLQRSGGSYTFINGPLAFDVMFPGTALVSIATAAQGMLAGALMKETADTPVRVNELVLYSAFGWGEDMERRNRVTGEDIGRATALLASDRGAGVRGRSIHLKSPEELHDLLAEAGPSSVHAAQGAQG